MKAGKLTPPLLCFEDLYQRTCFVEVGTVTGQTILKVGVCFPDSEAMKLTPEMCADLWPVIKRFAEGENLTDI